MGMMNELAVLDIVPSTPPPFSSKRVQHKTKHVSMKEGHHHSASLSRKGSKHQPTDQSWWCWGKTDICAFYSSLHFSFLLLFLGRKDMYVCIMCHVIIQSRHFFPSHFLMWGAYMSSSFLVPSCYFLLPTFFSFLWAWGWWLRPCRIHRTRSMGGSADLLSLDEEHAWAPIERMWTASMCVPLLSRTFPSVFFFLFSSSHKHTPPFLHPPYPHTV